MRKHYKTNFYCNGFGSIDGSRITGFIHKARKELPCCIGCVDNIKVGESYIQFYSELMGGERCHLDCYSFDTEGNWLAIGKRDKYTWLVQKFINAKETIDPKRIMGILN